MTTADVVDHPLMLTIVSVHKSPVTVKRCLRLALRSIMVATLAAVILGQTGCATVGPQLLPPPPSESLRQQMGTVAVTVSPVVPEFDLATPAKGAGEGLQRGAGVGAATGVVVASSNYYFPISTILLGPPLALLGALVGAPIGALRAEPATLVEEREATLRGAVQRLELHETIRDRVLAVAWEQAGRTLVPIDSGQPFDLRSLREKGLDALLHLSVEKFGFEGLWTPNPRLTLVMELRTQLIMLTRDSAEDYTHSLAWHGLSGTQEKWAANGGALFHVEVERACAGLAERVVEEVFLLYFPTQRPGGK